jgi:hypothetical protein
VAQWSADDMANPTPVIFIHGLFLHAGQPCEAVSHHLGVERLTAAANV